VHASCLLSEADRKSFERSEHVVDDWGESRDRIVLVAHRRELLTALTGPPATGNILWFVAHFEGGEKCSGF
jgi:hypothetical protein